MSIIDYKEYKVVSAENPSFNALIMAAMAKADNFNLCKLKTAFPHIWDELMNRHLAPGGALTPTELEYVTQLVKEVAEELHE